MVRPVEPVVRVGDELGAALEHLVHQESLAVAAVTDIDEAQHRVVEALFAQAHSDQIALDPIDQRNTGAKAEEQAQEQRRVDHRCDVLDDNAPQIAVPHHVQNMEIDRQMPGLVGVDVPECLMAHRILDLFQKELQQRPIEGYLQ
ncbi:Uncharacterised protein [Mycobacteroides abscessus]|nr:Uncharacterised protein [Mycobacteroides abscessus]